MAACPYDGGGGGEGGPVPHLLKGHTFPFLHGHGQKSSNPDVCFPRTLDIDWVTRFQILGSVNLEEESVILEPRVGRLHSGEHPGHGNACRPLDVVVERAEPGERGEIHFAKINLKWLTCCDTSRGI